MKRGSVSMLLQRGLLATTMSLVCAGTMGVAYAADVQINTPPGGNFVVKDNAGVNTLLKADGSGPVTVPNLSTAPTYTTGVCFGPGGVMGQCAAAIGGFADFYALMFPDNLVPVAVGAAVEFPQDGPASGAEITRTGASTFNLSAIGTYQVMFQVSVTEAGQLVLRLNGALVPTSVVGRDTGTSQIVGISLVTTIVINSILEVINPPGNSTALTITPLAGGTHSVSAHLVITRLR